MQTRIPTANEWLEKNALTELFRKERKEDFDSQESLELPNPIDLHLIFEKSSLKNQVG
jgi:hypothetical protein